MGYLYILHTRMRIQHPGHQRVVIPVHGILYFSMFFSCALLLAFLRQEMAEACHKMPQMASETARVETPVVSPGPSECDCSNVSNGVRLRFYAQQASGFHLPPRCHGGWWDYSLGEHRGRGNHSGEARCVFLNEADAAALHCTSFACSNKYEMTIE